MYFSILENLSINKYLLTHYGSLFHSIYIKFLLHFLFFCNTLIFFEYYYNETIKVKL